MKVLYISQVACSACVTKLYFLKYMLIEAMVGTTLSKFAKWSDVERGRKEK